MEWGDGRVMCGQKRRLAMGDSPITGMRPGGGETEVVWTPGGSQGEMGDGSWDRKDVVGGEKERVGESRQRTDQGRGCSRRTSKLRYKRRNIHRER